MEQNKKQTMDELIARINELYHKSRTPEGLNSAEQEEQAALRRDYIQNIRANMRSQLNNISIQNEDGSVTNLGNVHGQETTS